MVRCVSILAACISLSCVEVVAEELAMRKPPGGTVGRMVRSHCVTAVDSAAQIHLSIVVEHRMNQAQRQRLDRRSASLTDFELPLVLFVPDPSKDLYKINIGLRIISVFGSRPPGSSFQGLLCRCPGRGARGSLQYASAPLAGNERVRSACCKAQPPACEQRLPSPCVSDSVTLLSCFNFHAPHLQGSRLFMSSLEREAGS